MAFVGLIYILVFTPLTVWISHSRGLDVVDVLLFVDFSGLSISHGFREELARLVAPANVPFLFSFGLLYGVATSAYVLLRLSVRSGQWMELIVTSNGLMLGYALTIGVSFLFGITSTLIRASEISFAYVFLVIYASRAVTRGFSHWGIKSKYEHAIGGIQGITVAWILSRIFGDQSVIFSGLIFYVCTFVAISFFEVVFSQIQKWLLGVVSVEELMPRNTDARQPIRLAGRDFWTSAVSVAIIGAIFPLIAYWLMKLVAGAT